jgi:preprotein translocase subunit YajC
MHSIPFLPVVVVLLGAYLYFLSRQKKKAMQATIDLHESLTIGDWVHTTSGMEATVVGVDDDTVDLEIAPGVVTTWMKLAIRDKIEPDTDEDDEDDEEESTAASPGATELTDSDATADADRLTKD